MKKILSFALFAALLLNSCTEKDKEPVLAPGAAPTITSPSGGTEFVLADSTSKKVMSVFTWSGADFGFNAGVSYTLELDKAGNGFADPIVVGSVNGLSLDGISQEKINTIMISSKDLPSDEFSEVEIRVVAKLSSDASLPVLTSQPVALKIKPYKVVINYPFLHVPGSYQIPDDWQPADSNTVIYSLRSDEKYEGYIYYSIPNAKYKFTKGPAWTNNWGDNGNDGSLESSGADIPLVDPGMYRLNVDLNGLTHTSVKTDWGVLGSATPNGWDADHALVYDQATNSLKTTLNLVPGDVKFRANGTWDINLGDTGANKKMEYGGDNIKVNEAGNYNIELILSGAVYTYKISKN